MTCSHCGKAIGTGWVAEGSCTTYATAEGQVVLCSPACDQEWVTVRQLVALATKAAEPAP